MNTRSQKTKLCTGRVTVLGELPSNPVQGDAIWVRDISQIQIDFFHRVAAEVVKRGHVGAFDGAKLGSPTQNSPVDDTYSMSGSEIKPKFKVFWLDRLDGSKEE